jgi:hypothetical protein
MSIGLNGEEPVLNRVRDYFWFFSVKHTFMVCIFFTAHCPYHEGHEEHEEDLKPKTNTLGSIGIGQRFQ